MIERFTIDGPAGALELALQPTPGAPRGIALVAHPHPLQGGTLDNKVAQTLARTFHALGYAALRFNMRGAGASEGVHDDGPGEADDARAALAFARSRFGALPVVLAGFSFGSYVQALVALHEAPEHLVFVGPAVERIGDAKLSVEPIVIHGEEDDVVPLASVFAWARPREIPVVVFPGCGHFFHGRLLHLSRTIAALWAASPHAAPVPGA